MSGAGRFEISVPERALEDLRARLRDTRWPEQPEGEGWELGADYGYLRRLCDHWAGGYDWRATERRLNALGGVRWRGLHAIRVEGGDGVPVLFVHGWPGAPLEYLDVVDRLVRAGHPVAVPSLPGYAWSDDPGEPLNIRAVAARLRSLVEEGLGWDRYAVAGGDWGTPIATRIAFEAPRKVAAVLVATPGTLPAPGDLAGPPLSEDERAFIEGGQRWRRRQGHHMLLQSTVPDAAGLALNDSPAGLAAYLVEKYRSWSDCDGDVERRFSKDDLCDFLTTYWTTGTITSSMRLYLGERSDRWRLRPGERITVPAAAIAPPREIASPPREWAERVFSDLRRWHEPASGGHFAAFEEPEAFADELLALLAEID